MGTQSQVQDDVHRWLSRREGNLLTCGDEFTGGRFDDNEIKTLFARIDTGNDGAIEKDELERFLVGTFDGRALPRLVRYTVHRID